MCIVRLSVTCHVQGLLQCHHLQWSRSGKENILYLHDDHFDIIISMPAFLSRNYFSIKRNRGYDHKEDHKCNNVCHCCRKVHDSSQEDWIQCDRCCKFFLCIECFDPHKRSSVKGKSTCKTIYRCKECGKTVNRKLDLNHQCGQTFCKQCKDFFPESHRYYMIPEETDFQAKLSTEEELVD